FGISKVAQAMAMTEAGKTSTSAILGSPHYMSPEQIQNASDVDPRSDVWAIGVIVHELVSGELPFDSETIPYLFVRFLQDTPQPPPQLRPEVPAALERVVARCLEKDPAKRFASVSELAAALAECGSPAARASAERIARVLHGRNVSAAALARTSLAVESS